MIEKIFWFFLFLIFYCYCGYPFLLFVLGLFFDKRVKRGEITPSVSLLIPAYNEEKIIQKKIENSLELEYPKEKLEIIIASESYDRTNEIAKLYEKKGVKLITFPERKGKQYTIYRTIPQCQGKIIVLTDANGMFQKDALLKLARNFYDPRIGCVSGELKYINPKETSVGEGEGIYWQYEIFVKKLESRLQSLLGANGSIFAFKKELYKPLSEYRGDDFEIPIRILQQGYGVVFEPEALSTEEVYPETKKDFKRKVVIVGWHFRGAFILLKKSFQKFQLFLIFQLVSHKILRWLIGFFLIFVFLANIFLFPRFLYSILLFLQIIFYLLAILGYFWDKKRKKLNKIINLAYYFCVVNLAALFGVINAILNKQKPTWEKVR